MSGLDPYEERLLIILLGGGIGLLFAIVLAIICCRKYRLDRSGPGGKERKWNQQQMMAYQQPGRAAYFPTGHGMPQAGFGVQVDPVYLDPGRAGARMTSPSGYPNLNPTYSSVPMPAGRAATGGPARYPSQQV